MIKRWNIERRLYNIRTQFDWTLWIFGFQFGFDFDYKEFTAQIYLGPLKIYISIG